MSVRYFSNVNEIIFELYPDKATNEFLDGAKKEFCSLQSDPSVISVYDEADIEDVKWSKIGEVGSQWKSEK